MDFRVRPNQVYSYIQGRSGRKQLYIGFDAIPPPGRKHCCPWGASIGLGFDFRNEHGIITECVNDYEEFISKVCKATVLFDATFGKLGLGGYREPANEFWESEPVTADKTWKYPVDITQNWLFFGRRFTPEAITGMGSLDDFVDECIRVFDVICEGGYYHVGNKLPPHKHRINPSLSFDNFVTGKSNELAHAAALDVVESPGMTYNPLFIYGGVGLGRTHLLHAIGNEFKLKSPQARICYVHATNFVSDVVRAFKTKKFDEFKIFYNSLDLLLFDDIQYISDKPGTQQELCYALNSLIGNNKQVVITCDTTPTEIYGITPRLRSRFSGGLTVAVEPPDLEMRVAILLNKSASNNNPIGEDVAYFVAKHVRADIGEDIRKLEGVLKRIAAFALFHHRPITVDLVKEALAAERSYLEDDRA
jgi:chromosomal replication initiator protein DnaA